MKRLYVVFFILFIGVIYWNTRDKRAKVEADPPESTMSKKEDQITEKDSAQLDPSQYSTWHKITEKPHFAPGKIIAVCAPKYAKSDDNTDKNGPHDLKPINIYLNDVGFKAYQKKEKIYPEGTVIVKEKLDSNLKPLAIGAMIKGEDKIWQYYFKDKEIELGRLESCVQCHTGKTATDEVFGYWAHKEINENKIPNQTIVPQNQEKNVPNEKNTK